jgi:hypothetical protein
VSRRSAKRAAWENARGICIAHVGKQVTTNGGYVVHHFKLVE